MSPRLAPALGLAAACVMLTGVGVIAISLGDGSQQPSELAGAIAPTTRATVAAPAPAIRRPTINRTTRPATTPTAATAVGTTGSTASAPAVNPNAVASSAPIDAISSPPAFGASVSAPATSTALTAPTLRPAGGVGAVDDQYAQAVWQAVNQARAAHHLAPLSWSVNLQQSARRHNRAMATTNTLSHQVEGETALGGRETSAGVEWTYAAENIGWTRDRSVAGALDIEARMYGEKPPNDAHRQNILSSSATSIGIDAYFDAAHGRLWLTEDFSG